MTTTFDNYLASVFFRLSFGLLLCSLALMAQASQFDSHQLELSSVQLSQNNTQQKSANQFITALERILPNKQVLAGKTRMPTFSEVKQDTFCLSGICLNLTSNENNTSLMPQLRIESKDSRIEIRERSIWMTWSGDLPR